ncbi:hypothetical protein M8C21_025693, partial [Ambrosia artemisiifolia]
MVQRSHQLQQPCSSSMIAPSSNQRYCGKNFQSLWPDEEK